MAGSTNGKILEVTAKTLLLVPGTTTNLALALKLAEAGLAGRPESPSRQTTRGMAAYRLGRWHEALTWLEPARTNRDPEIACLAGYFAAMARQQLGETTPAKATLEQARQRLAPVLHRGHLGRNWEDLGRCLIVQTEAERLILGREVSPPVTAESLAAARENPKAARELPKEGRK